MPTIMRRHNRLISASEIGTWCYCHKAWHLQRLGYRSSLTNEQIAGTKYHEARHRDLRAAHWQRAAARIVVAACMLLLILLAIFRRVLVE